LTDFDDWGRYENILSCSAAFHSAHGNEFPGKNNAVLRHCVSAGNGAATSWFYVLLLPVALNSKQNI